MDAGEPLFWAILVAATFCSVKSQINVCREASVADVVFLVDSSIGPEKSQNVQDFLSTLVNGLDLGKDKIRVGLIQSNNIPRTEFFLSTYQLKEDVLKHLQGLKFNQGNASTGHGLQFMLEKHFQEMAGSRRHQGVPQLAVLITDRPAHDDIAGPASAIKNADILLYAIGLQGAVFSDLRQIGSEPDDKFIFMAADFSLLNDLSQSVLLTICATIVEETQQGSQVSPACRKAAVADLVFLVDSSTSIGPSNFQKVKNFLYSLVSGLEIGRNQVRVGLAQFNDNIFKAFLLNQFSLKSEVLEQIQSLPYRTGGTRTGSALDYLRTTYFTESAGSRAKDNVPQIVILVTDGESNDEVAKAANRLKEGGVSIYVVGINVQDIQELETIASKPFEKFLFSIEDFNILKDLSSNILPTLCSAVKNQIQAFTKSYADVVFLVDTSKGTSSASFHRMKSFILRVIDTLEVGHDKYQIGLAQYGHQGHVEFLLNTYHNPVDIITHIQQNFVLRGGARKTGNALQYIEEKFFQEKAGSRFSQGIPQYAVVITSGQSEDSFLEATQKLKERGVKIMAVGVQDFDSKELEVIATPPLVFEIEGQDGVRQLHQDVRQVFESSGRLQFSPEMGKETLAVCTSASLADIVFLVEASNKIGLENFQLAIEFLGKMIHTLNIGHDKVRIGLVLYSDEPKLEFGLDTFLSKSEILSHLNKLPFIGGNTKTGAALNFLRSTVFTQQKGSRSRQGVQQLAVVITEGYSQDEVDRPASLLRRAGVTVFAVGTWKASGSSDLQKIASHPPRKHATYLESFLQLSVVSEKIKKRLCTEIVQKTFVPMMTRDLKEGCVNTEEADFYFLIDGSGSIQPVDFEEMKTFMNELINTFNVGADQVRFGVVQYSDSVKTEFNISEHTNVNQLKRAISNIHQIGGGTATGAALRFMKDLFSHISRDKVPRFLIVITDGESQDAVAQPAEELRQEEIIIYAIGVKDANTKELLEISGSENTMFFVNDFDSLKHIQQDVIRDICFSEVCKDMKADILFLVDGSERISPGDFDKIKGFMEQMVNKSIIGPEKVQIGLLQFSSSPREEFQLNTSFSKVEILRAISNMVQIKEDTRMGSALSFSLPYFDRPRGGRPNVPQYLIIIISGKSEDSVKMQAKALRDRGIKIFAIGVHKASNTQLLEVTGAQDRIYYEDNFDTLGFLEKDVFFRLCNTEKACKKTEVADILFLVHASGGITKQELPAIHNLMEAIVNDSLVGKDNVRFGVISYSDKVEVLFSLNTYITKTQIREAIFQLKPKVGKAHTATALMFAKGMFGERHGGRQSLGITQILVLITNKPTESEERRSLEGSAEALEQANIDVFAIGIKNVKRQELQTVTRHRDRAFMVQSYRELDDLHQKVTHVICNESKPICDNQQIDLVFLIDGSLSIHPRNFTAMKTFMKQVVNSFTIGQDRVRVGVAQYSTDPQKEFYLNASYSSAEVKQFIDKITQLRGKTYTGIGLRFVKSFFEPANGSRKNLNVVQTLVVITDGMSNDSVVEAAKDLRNEEIIIFAIGIGVSNLFELQDIAGSAQRVFMVGDFGQLGNIERKVVSELCEVENPVISECSIDISVGLDTSNSARLVQQQLQKSLPDLMQRLTLLSNISCADSTPLNVRLRFLVPSPDGQARFDSGFEQYNEGIIRKFFDEHNLANNYMNVAFMQSLSNGVFSSTSAKVKVLLVFTDGLDDDLKRLKETSEFLRLRGFHALILVGLQSGQKLEELQEIEFGRGFDYKQPLSITMKALPRLLLKQLDTAVERECCKVNCKVLGEPGNSGEKGYHGRKGEAGLKGMRGFPGIEGESGERGLIGLPGHRGDSGCPGIRGQKGSRGFAGEMGSMGDNGMDGVTGEQGERGSSGISGEKGNAGNQGLRGPPGEPGEPGGPGLRGDPGEPGTNSNIWGPRGQKGKQGRQGRSGVRAEGGMPGDQGVNGPRGKRGSPGPKGVLGETGMRGIDGVPGRPGLEGPRGTQGPPGTSGLQGLPGAQGNPGPQGPVGANGNNGPRGKKGELGYRGESGRVGPQGPRGQPGIDGQDNYGHPGRKGTKGESGFPGYPGVQGEDGDKGQPGNQGPKGFPGRRGNSGLRGHHGPPGDRGPPGPMGTKGSKGLTDMMPCDIVDFTRKNCPCLSDKASCPLYPTEVVFALDMSEGVREHDLERMRAILLSLIRRMSISQSNCPTDARVAIVSYNARTHYLVRFSEFQSKNLLLQAVHNIPLEHSRGHRDLGTTMRFVARNVFKRVRNGILLRKVAIFFATGPSTDVVSINTAMLEFSALDIIPTVITFADDLLLQKAILMDDTNRFKLFVWENEEDEDVGYLADCVLCYDRCKEDKKCEVVSPRPIPMDMDITYVLDGSSGVTSDMFSTAKNLVGSMLNHFIIASHPNTSVSGTRVALVQQAVPGFFPYEVGLPVKKEFDLVTYRQREQMQRHIQELVHPLRGSPCLGHALEWVLEKIFLTVPFPRKKRFLFLFLGSETSPWDKEKLRRLILEAKCEGFILFTVALGKGVSIEELANLSSFPPQQHSLHLTEVSSHELDYYQAFIRAFLNLLKSEVNQYPPPFLLEECEELNRGDTRRKAA